MAILLKSKIFKRKNYQIYEKFVGSNLLDPKEINKAKNVDEIIKKQINLIYLDDKINNCKDLLKKYWLIGKKLQFVDDLDISKTDFNYVWAEIFFYATSLDKLLSEKRNIENLKRNQFRKYYLLGKIQWSTITKLGTWSNWSEIFESNVFQDDLLLDSFVKSIEESKLDSISRPAFRNIMKAIRLKFKNKKIIGIFSKNDLIEILNNLIEPITKK